MENEICRRVVIDLGSTEYEKARGWIQKNLEPRVTGKLNFEANANAVNLARLCSADCKVLVPDEVFITAMIDARYHVYYHPRYSGPSGFFFNVSGSSPALRRQNYWYR